MTLPDVPGRISRWLAPGAGAAVIIDGIQYRPSRGEKKNLEWCINEARAQGGKVVPHPVHGAKMIAVVR